MPDTLALTLSEEEQRRLLDWWRSIEEAHQIVKRLTSLVSELRLNKDSSHADGMILFYRAVSEISYGYAGVRGGVRRAFTKEYSKALQLNIVMCLSFVPKFSVDAKVLLERVANRVTGPSALQLIQRIRETLMENDEIINELERKAHNVFGKDSFKKIQEKVMQDMTLPM
ncbi:hypothetical protein KHA93_12000 [Bacillus sp. FJAT-49732]|uniref:Uncharacterized protein n=1 Tax=Lederbergia citrisecunda TaxID=2833583 RepID=A0A942TR64_9BACI|nr:hypothetical protein [Lederbergia citrisecunda]MBS4200354.1 hypothetical protein [Lederbergia citrisecunda]